MKKLFKVFLTVILSALISHTAMADFKKTKIAVLDFQTQGEKFETDDMGKIVAEWLITDLVKEGRFDVIERRLLISCLLYFGFLFRLKFYFQEVLAYRRL